MSNDPRDLDGKRLQMALHQLGRNPEVRARLIDFLKDAESTLVCPGSVREDVTGPIVDALHDDNDEYEKTLSDGTRFRYLYRTKIARDFYMAQDAQPSHVWEPQTTKLLLSLAAASKGDVIVGGAYFGDQAVLVAKAIAGQDRLVHCFEPNGDQARMLEQNVAINDLRNVRVHKVGLWSRSDAHLKLEGFDSFANAIEVPESVDAFQTVTIDDYRASMDRHVGLIQIDIEGAELEALRGARTTLLENRPDVVFEVHRSYVDWSEGLERTEICRLLGDLGYSIYAVRDFNTHHEMGAKPVELIPVDRVYLDGPPHGFNMLATHRPENLVAPGFRIVEHVSPKLLAHKDPKLHHPADGL